MPMVQKGSYQSATFFKHFLLLQLLNGLQQATVVCNAIHAGVFFVLFGIHVPQQLNNVNVLFLLGTFLFGWRSEDTEYRKLLF